ncbi:hypothetical protein [Parasphingorhabdus sp.]
MTWTLAAATDPPCCARVLNMKITPANIAVQDIESFAQASALHVHNHVSL